MKSTQLHNCHAINLEKKMKTLSSPTSSQRFSIRRHRQETHHNDCQRKHDDLRVQAKNDSDGSVSAVKPSKTQSDERGKNVTLNDGIAEFYDESTPLWEEMWGEHCHHGYYPNGDASNVDHKVAQIDMIDRALSWANISNKKNILDVGCGLGGSSRHFAKKWGANVKATGITLSPVQANRGNQLSKEQNLEKQVSLKVADALEMPFEDKKFDFVYSMESGEHMPDKQSFIRELVRVCSPNGRILIVTWCHRNLNENETELAEDEQSLLKHICDAYYLPAWCSPDTYIKLMKNEGLKDIKTADWSLEVRPFWKAVIKTALSLRGITGFFFKSGLKTLRGALIMPLMSKGLKDGTIKFTILTARK